MVKANIKVEMDEISITLDFAIFNQIGHFC